MSLHGCRAGIQRARPHTLRSLLQYWALPVLANVANLDGGTKHTHTPKAKEKTRCRVWLQGLRWGGAWVQASGGLNYTVHGLMRVWERGRRYFKTPCSSGRGRCRTMCLSLCGTPTSEMSNAGLVGPDPAPNHSDWPTRAVCAPRWFCRSEGVAGALSFKCLEKRAVPGPLSLTGPSQRSGWEITRGISGSGKSTPPSDRRRHGIFANTDGHLSFCERGAGSRTIPCKPCFYVGRQSSGGSETPACTGNMWVKQVNWHPALPMVDQVAASFG